MDNNSSGKVITIFVIITALLLLTITAISLFYLKVENEGRKMAESQMQELQAEKITLNEELKEVKKQSYLLEEKNKEADERINGLLDELELEKGLREEMKLENSSIKEQLDEAVKEKERLRQKLSANILDLEQKMGDMESKMRLQADQIKESSLKNKEIQASEMNFAQKEEPIVVKKEGEIIKDTGESQKVELEQIVVNPALRIEEETNTSDEELFIPILSEKIPDGRILTVDIETEFVIVNLGKKDGIVEDMFMSVYRGPHYLGDIKITRVQPAMSAADIIPPFSSQMVRKNDQVVAK